MLRGEPPAWRSGALSWSQSSCSIGQDFPISVGPRATTRKPKRTVQEPYNWMAFSIWTCSGAATPSSCSHVLWDGCLGRGFVNAAFQEQITGLRMERK